MRCGDQPEVDLARLRRSQALELPFLKHAQQLGLQLERQVADFIEKERPPVCDLETPMTWIHGAGECAALVAEQLALDQRGRQRRAVDADERALASRAPIVQRPREQLLARACIACQEHRRVGGRDLHHPGEALAQGRTFSDDFVKSLQMLDFLAQVHVLGTHPPRQPIDLASKLVKRRFLFRAKHGRRHAFRNQAQRLNNLRAECGGRLRRGPSQRARHVAPYGHRHGNVGPDGDAVRRVQKTASIRREISGDVGQHEGLALKKLLGAPGNRVEVVDIRLRQPGAIRDVHDIERRASGRADAQAGALDVEHADDLAQHVVDNGPNLIRRNANEG